MGGLPGQVNESPPRGRITRDALQLRGEDDCHANDTSAAGHGVLGVLVVVGVAAVLVEGFVFSASRLWFMPDSAWYISLATGLAERWDFSQNLFQFRTPGYPLFLAALFLLFGHSAGVALLVVQHAMVVGCSLLSAMIAWTLWPRRSLAIITGLFGAVGFHLSGYASAVLTEVPYAFMLTVCVYLLVRYCVQGGLRVLLAASVVAGLAALIRPIGFPLVGICAIAAFMRTRYDARALRGDGERAGLQSNLGGLRRVGVATAAAILPAVLLLLPVMINNHRAHGHFKLTCMRGFALYSRTAFVDRVDSTTSESVGRIRQAVETARDRGWIKRNATHHDFWPSVRACQLVYDASLADVSDLMQNAGLDLMWEHPWEILRNTAVHCHRTYVMPDEAYRMLPGGTPGVGDRWAKKAELYAVDTFTSPVARRVGSDTLAEFFPASQEPTATTPAWSAFCKWYHARIEEGTPVTGLLDTPYEEFAMFSVVGMVLALGRRRRLVWLLVAAVIMYQVVLGAFLAGALPRYTVALHPLMHVFAALFIVGVFDCVTMVTRLISGRLRTEVESAPRYGRTMEQGR